MCVVTTGISISKHKAHRVLLYRKGTDLGASGVGRARKHAQNATDMDVPAKQGAVQPYASV